MTINLTVGSVTVGKSAAASANPVTARPTVAADSFSTFAEVISASGIAAIAFNAFAAVAGLSSPADAKVKWPDRYGTNQKPFGRPYSSATGDQEVLCVDGPGVTRWTDAVHGSADSRVSFLKHYAELAVAIASAIKGGIEDTFKCSRATLSAGTVTVSVPGLSTSDEIFLQRRTSSGTPGELSVGTVTSGSFVINSASATDTSTVSWMVVKG